jgi:hypothetical protein
MNTRTQNWKLSPFVWLMIVMISFHPFGAFGTPHQKGSETAFFSSNIRIDYIRGEVLDSFVQEFSLRTIAGSKRLSPLVPKKALVLAVAAFLHSTNRYTVVDRPIEIAKYRLFVRKFSPQASDEDFLLS